MKTLAAMLLSLTLLPACASTGGDYFINRGGDLVDIVRFHVMAGPGISYKWEVTHLLHAGLDYEYSCWAAGLGNRELGIWKEDIFSWGLIVGHHQETIAPKQPDSVWGLDHDRLSGSYGWTFGEKGGNTFEQSDPNNWLDNLTVRGTVMLGIGADLELRFGELIDFVGGIFQFDPSGDDRPYSSMKKAE